jgi:hypothetical protein
VERFSLGFSRDGKQMVSAAAPRLGAAQCVASKRNRPVARAKGFAAEPRRLPFARAGDSGQPGRRIVIELDLNDDDAYVMDVYRAALAAISTSLV